MDFPAGTVLLDESFGLPVVNATDVPTHEVYEALGRENEALVKTMAGWAEQTRMKAYEVGTSHNRAGGLFQRDRYVGPTGLYEQMRLAGLAVETDDIVSGVAETTEALAFTAIDFFAEDPDEEDAYNQMAARIDLDRRLREIWHELFVYSQCYIAVWWQQQSFKVRGRTKSGNQRRKTIDFVAPRELTLLDPLKVVPVGNLLFGQERLAYIANAVEADQFDTVLGVSPADRVNLDEVVQRLVVGRYEPANRAEAAQLNDLGVDSRNLYLLDPNNVFRHTATRPAYRRLSPVRMKSIFELLDMKLQLRQMERAHLVGGSNFIVVITKGSDAMPAQPAEIANLQSNVRTMSRVPVMVGDHRLKVEIVTPKLDSTLRAERWNTIDARISARLYQIFLIGNYSAGASGDDSIKLAQVVARGMESRRHMIKRSLELNIFRPMFERNEQLTTPPKLQFHPRSIALDFDAAYASFLFDLRQSNELSRETILNQFDLDQSLEAELRLREQEEYDDIFKTQVPFSTPANNVAIPDDDEDDDATEPPPSTQRDNGGGRRNGGGAAPGTGQGQPPRRATRRSDGTGRKSPRAAQVTFTVEGVDSVTAEGLVEAMRAALGPQKGPDDDA